MSEHHTQGRQGQGARRRRIYHSNRIYRQRMPRPEEPKPSFFKRVLSFFGIGKKGQATETTAAAATEKSDKAPVRQVPQHVRVVNKRSSNKEPSARSSGKKRHRFPIPPPPAKGVRLYVGNLSFDSTEPELEDLFKGFGHVRRVEIIYNPRTYRSRGYAFVEMETAADAGRAMEVLNEQPFMGRELRISIAGENNESEQSGASREEKSATTPALSRDKGNDVSADDADFGEETVVKPPNAHSKSPTDSRQA